jgi:hypothetical protein
LVKVHAAVGAGAAGGAVAPRPEQAAATATASERVTVRQGSMRLVPL